MQLTKSRALSVAMAAAFAVGGAVTTATAAPVSEDVPTFQEFTASTFQDERTGATSSTATSPRTASATCASSTTRWSPARATSTRTPSSSTG